MILTADKNTEFALRGILERPKALEICAVSVDYFVHPHRDPGCLRESHNFLRAFIRNYSHALVLLDRDGCGRESSSRAELEDQIETELNGSGWEGRAAAIVIDPELEAWVWSSSPVVASVLGWRQRKLDLQTWLQQQEYVERGQTKPEQPKEAMENALRIALRPRSSALYEQLAQQVSLAKCEDSAFLKLKTTLQAWFPT